MYIVYELTCTPARIKSLPQTLCASNFDCVSEIWLHIPDRHARSGLEYPDDAALAALLSPPAIPADVAAKVRVNRTRKDWGPLTKYIGCLTTRACTQVPDDAIVITGDDDFGMPAPTLLMLARAVLFLERKHGFTHVVVSSKGQDAAFWGPDVSRAFSHSNSNLFTRVVPASDMSPDLRSVVPPPTLTRVDVCEGFSGVAMRLRTLRLSGFAALTTRIAQLHSACWESDDLVVSAVLAYLNVPRFVLLPRLPLVGFDLSEPLSGCDGGNSKKYTIAAQRIEEFLTSNII